MPHRHTRTTIKIVLGFFLGVAFYYAFEKITAPEWTDSVEAAMEDCLDQGLGTRFRVSEDVLTDLECVALDETGESPRGGTEGSP